MIVGDVFLSRLPLNLLCRTKNKEKFEEIQTRAMRMIVKACFHVCLIKNRDRLCNFIGKSMLHHALKTMKTYSGKSKPFTL